MKLIIDSANLKKIDEVLLLGVSSGITTNPSILNKEVESRYAQIVNILKYKDNDIYIQLVGLDVASMYQDYKELRAQFMVHRERIIYKIPINKVGLKVINKVLKNNPKERILGTTIYSFTQAVVAIMAGCESLAIYYNRIKVAGDNPNKVIQNIRTYIDYHKTKTTIIGASFKSATQIEAALLHGADTCTIAPKLFKEMYFDDRVEKDVKEFEKDHEELIDKTK